MVKEKVYFVIKKILIIAICLIGIWFITFSNSPLWIGTCRNSNFTFIYPMGYQIFEPATMLNVVKINCIENLCLYSKDKIAKELCLK